MVARQLLVGTLLVGSLCGRAAAPSTPGPDAGCVALPVGAYGVFVERVGDGCRPTDFVRAQEAQESTDVYVLVDHLASDDGTSEVLVLAKPLGGKTYSLALEVVRRLEDGSVDGTTWHSLGP